MKEEQTYGQIQENNGNPISYQDFEKEVAKRLKQYVLLTFTSKHIKLSKRLYRQGYTIADTVGMMILSATPKVK